IPAVAPAPDSSSRCRSPDTGLTFPVTWRTVPDSSEARYRTALDRSPRRRIVPEAYGKSQLVTAHDAHDQIARLGAGDLIMGIMDRKSTRLNSSHRCISYAVFCL